MNAKVSVVIPNYNGAEYIEACVDSLYGQNVRQFEIIVVDDASTDGSLDMIMKKYPEEEGFPRISYIRHFKNRGFCASVNDGIAAARSDYVILLNNDTVAGKDFVYSLWRAIRRKADIFSVSSRMISLKERDKLDDCGDLYCSLGWAFAPAKDKPLSKYRKRRKVFAACGGAAIYRKSMLIELGGFDEAHFAYLEDIDMGYRAKLKGYVNMYEPEAVVYHAGSATTGSRHNSFKVRISARNNLYLIYKNMPWWQILINLDMILAGLLIKQLYFIKKGLGGAYLKGIAEGIALCGSEGALERKKLAAKTDARLIWKIQLELMWNTLRRFIG